MHLRKHWLREASYSNVSLLQKSKDFKPKHQGFLPRRDASKLLGATGGGGFKQQGSESPAKTLHVYCSR